MDAPTALPAAASEHAVALTAAVLAQLGVRPGERVVVETDGDVAHARAEAALVAKPAGPGIEAIFGILHRPGQRVVTIEEMNEVIADGWAGKFDPNA